MMGTANPRAHPSHHTATTTTTATTKDKQLMEITRNFKIIPTIDLICCNVMYLFIELFITLKGNKRLQLKCCNAFDGSLLEP